MEDMLVVIIKALIISTLGYFIVRISGKKSVSQMTMPQMVIMLTLGTILAQPITKVIDKSMLLSFVAVGTLVAVMMLFEWLSIKSNNSEKFLLGTPVTLIKNGQIQVETLRKERLTIDTLEGLLREKGVKNINDCLNVTLEENGKIGYELRRAIAPITYKDCHDLIDMKIRQLVNDLEATFTMQKIETEQAKQRLQKYHVDKLNPNDAKKKEPTLFDETYKQEDAKSSDTELE